MPSKSCHSWFRLPKEFRPRELCRCRAAVASVGAELNAIIDVCEENHVGDESVGHRPLQGMPYVAKDMFDRIGRRGQWGGARSSGPASADAAILRLLDAAGARQVAVSSMTTLAYEPSGHNACLGRTINPWHPEIISGGSSSGSAALVAARCAYLGVGSDTGGSIRIPAACCGVVGLKPGHGKLVTDGAMPLAPSLDVIGFMTRRAEDLIHVWEVATPSSDAGTSISSVAVYSGLLESSSSSVRAAILAALRTLKNLGISEREVSDVRAITTADRDALTIMQVEAARIHDNTSLSGGDPALSRRIAKGREISNAEMEAALGRRSALLTAVLSSWQGCGAAILPVMAMPPPDATEVDPQSAQFKARTLYELSGLTRFVNALGLPAIAVPIGFDERGVPQSMQIVGRPDAEFALLRLAHLYQSNTKWLQQAPAICAATDPGESV